MQVTQTYLNQLTYKILGAAIEVHKQLGPGLLESVYEKCFIRELFLRGISFVSQKCVSLNYKGLDIRTELRFDVLVEDLIIVELKSVEGILPVHESVVLTYMRLAEKAKGIIINFNCNNLFKEGQRTLVNKLYGLLPKE